MYIHLNAFILSTGCLQHGQIIFEYFLDCLRIFPEIFNDIPRNVWRHFPECLGIFPGRFGNIPWNVWGHSRNIWRDSPECLATFPGMFEDIPRNVWGHFPECLRTFPGMFGDIPRNITFLPLLVFLTFRSRSCIPGFIYAPMSRTIISNFIIFDIFQYIWPQAS